MGWAGLPGLAAGCGRASTLAVLSQHPCALLDPDTHAHTHTHNLVADFKLDRLPASLRRLALSFDGQNRELSVPALPDHIRRVPALARGRGRAYWTKLCDPHRGPWG